MFAIVGAAGKVGYATSVALRQAGVPVRAILRDETKSPGLREIGCEVAIADLHDPKALAKAIGDADTVQVILPPSPQAKDTASQMRQAIESIASALEDVHPKRVLAISDYGAHVAHDIGMPTMCRAFEERLSRLDGHIIFLRSAEHMQGWGRAIPGAIYSGTLQSFHDPIDKQHPTISAPDLGPIAADLLLQTASGGSPEIVHAEGPRQYSANEVAAALAELLGREIKVQAVPRSQWKDALEKVMSPTLAELLIKANDAQNEGGLVEAEPSGKIRHGTTELIDALRPLLPQ